MPRSIVTALRERKRDRVAVELDGRPWRVLPTAAVVRAGLAVGRPLDRHTARELAREVRRAEALGRRRRGRWPRATDRAGSSSSGWHARACRRPHARRRSPPLLVPGLVDDARLAESRAELLARRGYGDAAIRADLRRRLVSPEAAAGAVAALEPEPERLRRLFETQNVTPALLRRLAGRGFSRDAAGRSGVVVCAGGVRRGTMPRHSIRRFACKSSFSETESDDRPLRPDDSEVAREVAQRLSGTPLPAGNTASRIAAA